MNIVRCPKPPKGSSKTQSVSNLNNKLRYLRNGKRWDQLVVITNRKSHTGFRLIPTMMTLNVLERHNSPYFIFFSPNWIALQANYVTVVKDRPIVSAKLCLPVRVLHLWPKLTHSLTRSGLTLRTSWPMRWMLSLSVDCVNWLSMK